MFRKKPLYLICLAGFTLFSLGPVIQFGFEYGPVFFYRGPLETYKFLFYRLKIPGLGETHEFGNTLTYSPFWNDRFIAWKYPPVSHGDGTNDWKYEGVDPETGQSTNFNFSWRGRGAFRPQVYGHRLWLAGYRFAKEVSPEVIEDEAVASDYVEPEMGLLWQSQSFLLRGTPARVEYLAGRFVITTQRQGVWTKTDMVVLPDLNRDWMLGATPVNFNRTGQIGCLNHDQQIHVFLYVDGHLLFQDNLATIPYANSPGGADPRSSSPRSDSANQVASALAAENAAQELTGWSNVRPAKTDDPTSSLAATTIPVDGGLLIEGKPAALIVDQVRTGITVGSVYRFDGSNWTLFATQEFPFGSNRFRGVVCQDGQRSYIVATTSMGASHVYAVEAGGIRSTAGAAMQGLRSAERGLIVPAVAALTLVVGIIFGVLVWGLMWWYTKPVYEFGLQTVKLASIGWRGLAKLVDLLLIFASTAGLGWVLTRNFDWLSLGEALNLRADHPALRAAIRVVVVLLVWMATIVITFVVMQARSGLTPGKWCCGLRTIRTSLRTCGLARSLAREVLMSLDAGFFLCWTPGILCIALTDHRQRLGDLLADTIVVNSRSLSPVREDGIHKNAPSPAAS